MSDAIANIQGHTQFTIADGAQSNPLTPGVYDICASTAVDIYVKIRKNGTTASDVTSATGYKIASGNTVPFRIASESVIGVAGGIAVVHKVGS